MSFICEPVPHRHSGIVGKFLHLCLFKTTVLDAVIHATQDARGILHRLLGADMRAAGADVGDVGALVVGSHLESAAGACRVLLKDEGNLLATQMLHLCASIFRRFYLGGEVQQEEDLLWCEV